MSRRPERRVLVAGLPHFGRQMAELIAGDGWAAAYVETGERPWRHLATLARETLRADLVYLYGGQVERGSRPEWLLRATRLPAVMHWCGTDVLYARRAQQAGRASRFLRERVVHLAAAPWLADELRPVVEAEYLPVASPAVPRDEPAPPFPSRFTVLAYLPDQRAEFYGRDVAMFVARNLPQARVLVVGGSGGLALALSNVEALGWQRDLRPLWAETTVLLRTPAHDGLSFMVQEALGWGRHVVWIHGLPGVTEVRDAEEAVRAVQDLFARHQRGALGLNEEGMDHARAVFRPELVRAALRTRFAALLERAAP